MSEPVDTIEKQHALDDRKTGPVEFIRETREELEKVSYPSSEDVRGTTLIVILNVLFFAVFLFLVDQGWAYTLTGLDWLINRLAGL